MTELSAVLQLQNKKGLHARAAAKFVKAVEKYTAAVKVTKIKSSTHLTEEASDYATVGGTSILGLMMLAAECGSSIEVVASGDDAQHVLDELTVLINSKFDEEE